MSFKAPWWLKNRHFQTVYPTIFRPTIKLLTKQERIELPDGDFLDLNWTLKKSGSIVIVLHGLGGSIKSKYASGILKAIDKNGWRGVFVHFRNCSESANRLKRSYHCGETGDLSFVIQEIRKREPNTPISIVGFSLGANVLLKWLGENPKQKDIVNAIAVSAPFDLKKTSQCLNRGFSKFYQRYLLRKLRILLHKKNKHYPKKQFQQSLNAKTLWEYDQYFTAPIHNFQGADDYYKKSSSKLFLKKIQTNTLIIHSIDDPFMDHTVPPKQSEISSSITLELTKYGGHVGFVTGKYPWKPTFWLENRIPSFLMEYGF